MRHLLVTVATILTLASGHALTTSAGDEFGALLVQSDPAGASVYVDGRSTCGGPGAPQPHGCCSPPAQLTGTRSNPAFSGSHSSGDATATWTYEFSGALNGS
jgi:hypothetical protein